MANTTLRAYIEELKFLLEREALEEVMAHCRHILQHFPKNIEVYRLLGRALLEKNRHPEAADVFQRVLSAIPDDFVSHLALSGIAEESGNTPQAIWHLENAYELEPNNGALRQEVKRLYERRDGIMPDRVPLSAGGLAQAYVKGRLYEQAISELNSALEQMPDRVDLRLKLAQVLWETDRHVEAADAALQVIEKLPNSIEANRLLATLWLKAGRPSDAAPFVSRLEQLDPFLAWTTVNPDQPLPPDAFALPHLDWDARTARTLGSDVPYWVNAISNVFDSPESVSLSGGVPNWREDAPATSKPANEPSKRPLAKSSMLNSRRLTEPDNASDVASDVPDWFKDVNASSTDASTASASDVPDWFKDVAASDKGPAEIPPTPVTAPAPMEALTADWLTEDDNLPSASDTLDKSALQGASSTGIVEPLDGMSWLTTGPLAPLEGYPETASPQVSEDMPDNLSLDWMTDANQAEVAEPQAADEQDPMSWLRPHDSAQADAVEPESDALMSTDSMNWLSEEPANLGRQVADANATLDDDDDADAWLANFTKADDSTGSAPVSGQDWLSTDKAAPPSEPNLEIEEDWLASFESGLNTAPATNNSANAQTSFEPSSASASGTSMPTSSDSVNDWFAAPGSSDEDATNDLPDWMSHPDTAGGASDSSDWLSEVGSSPAANTTATQDDFDFGSLESSEMAEPVTGDAPDWLSSMAPPAQSSSPAKSLDDLDFGSLENSDSESAEPLAGEAPDWLSAMAPPAKSGSSAKPTEMSLDDLDFGSLENTEAGEPVAGEAPDWLAGIAPSTESGSSVKPTAMSLDDLDFEKLSSPAQPLEPLQGDVPDWLSAFSSEPAPDAEATSHARHAMPEHFPEVDFDKLPIEPLPANAGSSGDRDFDFSGVAQPAKIKIPIP